jgi:hypothetical protein
MDQYSGEGEIDFQANEIQRHFDGNRGISEKLEFERANEVAWKLTSPEQTNVLPRHGKAARMVAPPRNVHKGGSFSQIPGWKRRGGGGWSPPGNLTRVGGRPPTSFSHPKQYRLQKIL